MFRRPKAPALYDSAMPPKVGRIRRVSRWWMGSARTLVVSAVFLAIVAATAVYLVVFPAPPVAPAVNTAATGHVSVPAETSGAAPSVSVDCKAQESVEVSPETLVLTTYSTQWYPVGAMLAPKSKTGGPQQEEAYQCFTRSPEGALYAVATRVAVEAQKVGAAGRQFSGYQWLSYGPDLATVSIAARAVNGATAEPGTARTFTAAWVGNDWQVSVLNQPAETLEGLRTFMTWGGA